MMKKIHALLLVLMYSTIVFAQSPNSFKYQAVLRDNLGNFLSNKSAELKISILQSSIDGLEVYSESHTKSTNQYGLVNLEIGNGTVLSGNFSLIDWANGPYYVKIVVNGIEIGTSQLLSVPYAKYADKAGNGFSGNYADLTGRPNLSLVASSGSFLDLVDKPAFFSGDYNTLFNRPTLFDGNWNSLTGRPVFSVIATSGSYNDLLDKPIFFSGDYNNLTNKPILFDGTWNTLTGKPVLSIIATSGNYDDLQNKPVIFSGDYNTLTNKPIIFDGTWNSLTGRPVFSVIATSGSYNDLLDKPTLFSGDYNNLTNKPILFDGTWNSLTGKPVLSIIATSGNYDDLQNKPVLFSGDYNTLTNKPIIFDGTWNSLTGRPVFSVIATSGSYNDLLDKPTLFSGNFSDLINKPTTLAGYGITDFGIVTPTNSQLLRYNDLTKKWENWDSNYISSENQQLSLSSNQLAISGLGGNTITFSNWDTDKTDDVTTNGDQVISGNKTFSGILTATNTIVANNGVNANNKTVSNVANPVNDGDAVNKAYVDLLEQKILRLQRTIQAGGNVTDADGNFYNTVKIGTQIWMAEDLKTKHYSNGDSIGTTYPATLDVALQASPKFQWAYNGDEKNVPTYGRLYTWYVAIDSRNVCPLGWHVPSDTDWSTLQSFLGGITKACGKLKEAGNSHWTAPNTGADNFTGFNGLPSGYRNLAGSFSDLGIGAYYWSTLGYDVANAWRMNLYYNANYMYWAYRHTWVGFSIRCVKD